MTRNDGGPAFPSRGIFGESDSSGMSLRDYFASHAPTCPPDHIAMQQQIDRQRNPYNEPHKPLIRTVAEIIADWNYDYAAAMLKARSK